MQLCFAICSKIDIFTVTKLLGAPIAKDLWIPNPLTPQLTFYNMVLQEIYNSSFELMAPLQFKEYVIAQRISRWKTEKGLNDLRKKIENQLDPESRDGRAQNMARFSAETINKIKPGDLFKAESSQKVVKKLLDEVLKKKEEILQLRSNLFDKDMNIKPWRANELVFYDSKKTLLEDLNNSLQKTNTMIITNINLLKRRANASAEQTAETKRKKRSARVNARKSAKEKEIRFTNKVDEVLKFLTDGKFTQAMKKKNEGNSICLEDINQNCQLVARFHYTALSWLINEDYFATDALNFVNDLAKQMETKLAKSRELNVVRKEKLVSSKDQRTLFQCFVNAHRNSEEVTASTFHSAALDSDTELHVPCVESDESD